MYESPSHSKLASVVLQAALPSAARNQTPSLVSGCLQHHCEDGPMDILIANGSAEIRSGIRDILSDEMPEAAFLEAADRTQALSLLKDRRISIALLDINTPGSRGLDLLDAARESAPCCR